VIIVYSDDTGDSNTGTAGRYKWRRVVGGTTNARTEEGLYLPQSERSLHHQQDITELTYTFAHRTLYTRYAPLSHSPPDVDLL